MEICHKTYDFCNSKSLFIDLADVELDESKLTDDLMTDVTPLVCNISHKILSILE